AGMIAAAEKGHISIEKWGAMTSVCSVGLDMIAIPGDTPASVITGIILDECAIGIMNNKTTAARIIPVPGKKPGDSVDYGGLLGKAPIMSVSQLDNSVFVNRGGRYPAPSRGLRN
ncbi:PFL family protein, partial [candidate division KSB1 bacterium]